MYNIFVKSQYFYIIDCQYAILPHMATETERKFLVVGDAWRIGENGTNRVGTHYKQGYLVSSKERTVRVRIAGDTGYLTIKGPAPEGMLGKPEYEYEIPLTDAEELFSTLCLPEKIEKTRYKIPFGSHVWEVDVFHGTNEGLVMAEVELQSEHEQPEIPDWIGQEVSDDSRYYNGRLAKEPFSTWN